MCRERKIILCRVEKMISLALADDLIWSIGKILSQNLSSAGSGKIVLAKWLFAGSVMK